MRSLLALGYKIFLIIFLVLGFGIATNLYKDYRELLVQNGSGQASIRAITKYEDDVQVGGSVLADRDSLLTSRLEVNLDTAFSSNVNIGEELVVAGDITTESDFTGVNITLSEDADIGGLATVGSISLAGDTIADFTGAGLQVTAGVLETSLGADITSAEIADSSISEVDLAVTNTPSDNQILSYDSATGTFTWVTDQDSGGDAATSPWSSISGVISPDSTGDDVAIGGATTAAPFYFDTSAGNLTLGQITADGGVALNLSVSADTDGDDVYGLYLTTDVGTGTLSTASRNAYGIYNSITNAADDDAGFNYDPTVYGLYNNIDLSSNATTYHWAKGVYNTNPTYPGNNSDIIGVENSFYLGGSGSYGIGTKNTFFANSTDGVAQTAEGTRNNLGELGTGDTWYGTRIFDSTLPTGGTVYGVHVDLDDPDYTNAWSIYINAGSAASYFGSDIYLGGTTSSTADILLGNAGNAVFNEQGLSTADFRIEGDTDANLLFVDASQDAIGFGGVPDSAYANFHFRGGNVALDINNDLVLDYGGGGIERIYSTGSGINFSPNNKTSVITISEENNFEFNSVTWSTTQNSERTKILSRGDSYKLAEATSLTNWRTNQFTAPTIRGTAGGSTETVTNAATVYIDQAPIQGSDASVTNPYALWIDDGDLRLDGNLITSATSGQVGYWSQTSNALYPTEYWTDELLIGGSATSSADIRLGVDGTVVFNEQGNDADFRIEGDTDANLFFVDASTDKVGIGTDTPLTAIDVVEDVNATDYAAATFVSTQESGNPAPGWTYGIIVGNEAASNADNHGTMAGIYNYISKPGSGTVTGLYGGYNQVGYSSTANSASADLYGAYNQAYSWGSAGALDTITGTYNYAQTTRTVNSLYGSYNKVSPSATTTNAYGLYVEGISGATNNYSLLTNAGNVVFNEGGDASTDFRIEGDTDANLFFVDASTDRIGIGINTPAAQLNIADTTANSGNAVRIDGYFTTDAGLEVVNYNGNAGPDTPTRNIFEAYYSSTNLAARIYGGGHSYFAGNMGLGDTTPEHKLDIEGYYAGNALVSLNETGSNDIFTASASGTTRFVIQNDGSVGIGTNAPGAALDITGTSDQIQLLVQANATQTTDIFRVTDQGGVDALVVDDTDPGQLYVVQNGIRVRTGSTSAGGIVLNNSAAVSNQLIVSAGFVLSDSTTPSASGQDVITLSGTSSLATSGTTQFTRIVGSFTPTSGTGVYNDLSLEPTINQTGGANGITRGLYVNPTLTSAADFRAIETVVGSAIFNESGGDYDFRIEGDTDANAFHVDGATNNIGIGIAGSSTAKLHLFSSAAADTDLYLNLRNQSTNSNQVAAIRLDSDQDADAYWGIFTGLGAGGPTNLVFRNENTFNQIVFSPLGQIGAGDSTPDHKLDIEGYYAGNALVSLNDTGGNDIFTASASGTTRFVIQNDGDVGIGTNSPGAELEIQNSTSPDIILDRPTASAASYGITFRGINNVPTTVDYAAVEGRVIDAGSTPEGALSLFTYGSAEGALTERVRIDQFGNVGISDTTPDHKLDIEGYYAGNALVSLNETGGNDIFTASASGTTKFTIQNSGLTDASVDGVATLVNAGAITDGSYSGTAVNGLLGVDSTNGRFYFRYGGGWHYVAQTAGFQIPEFEGYAYDFDKSEFMTDVRIEDGDFLIPFAEKRMADDAVHGLYARFSDVKQDIFGDVYTRLSDVEEYSFDFEPELAEVYKNIEQQYISKAEFEKHLSFSDKIINIFSTVVFKAGATYENTVEYLSEAVFKGSISVSADTAGELTVPANTKKFRVTFAKEFGRTPIVYLDPPAELEDIQITITDITPAYFEAEVSPGVDQEFQIKWIALLQNKDENQKLDVIESINSQEAVQVPTPSSTPVLESSSSAELVVIEESSPSAEIQ